MKRALFIAALLCAVTCRAQTPAVSPTQNVRDTGPVLPIAGSISIAQEYIRMNRVDISGQYIHSVKLEFEDSRTGRGYFWRIQWRWKMPRLGGEYGLRVYMDGPVEPEIAGP